MYRTINIFLFSFIFINSLFTCQLIGMQGLCEEPATKEFVVLTTPRIENIELAEKLPKAYVTHLCCDKYQKNRLIREDIGLIDYIHYPAQKECFVTTLIITRPENRKKGYGRKLVTEMLKNVHEMGCIRVTLRAPTGKNSPCSFYQKLGFIQKEIDTTSKLALFEYSFNQRV